MKPHFTRATSCSASSRLSRLQLATMSFNRTVLRSCQATLSHAPIPHSPCSGTRKMAAHVAKTALHTSTRAPRLRTNASGSDLARTHKPQKLPLNQGWRSLSSSRVCRRDRVDGIDGSTPASPRRESGNGSGGLRRQTSELPTKVKMVLDTPGKIREQGMCGYLPWPLAALRLI